MDAMTADFVERTRAHYREKFALHGATPQGVDWNGEGSQLAHFAQLAKLLPTDGRAFSVNDWGCGYGALAGYLRERFPGVRYTGIDLNEAMIEAAREASAGADGISFVVADRPLQTADHGLASGVFTLRLGRSDADCAADLERSIGILAETSRVGFAFNCLTSYSDPPKMREHLYYADPLVLFDLCKRRHAKDVALLHDYGLYAFTILVRKELG
jgi:SAM-dependent methyltransferase